MRYVIYGAGAIGGVIGGRLHLSGHEVALIARGAHLEALRENGLTLISAEGAQTLPIPAAGSPAELDLTSEDVVILAMKSQDTVAALDALFAAAPPAITVVCAQNGVVNERMALRRFPNVYGQLVILPGTHLEPGTVVASGPLYGVLDLGRYPHGSDERAASIAADLTEAGFGAVEDIAVEAPSSRNLANSTQAGSRSGRRRSSRNLACRSRRRRVSRALHGERTQRGARAHGASRAAPRPSRPPTSTARSPSSAGCTAARERAALQRRSIRPGTGRPHPAARRASPATSPQPPTPSRRGPLSLE